MTSPPPPADLTPADPAYADLVAEATRMIPTLAPDWTDHNPSDPGIALVELLAWLTDMLLFQAGEIGPEYTDRFLTLLGEPQPSTGTQAERVHRTIGRLREPFRAVTTADVEALVRDAARLVAAEPPASMTDAQRTLVAAGPVARVHCPPVDRTTGEVTVVVLRSAAGTAPELLDALAAFLDERRPLTTRLRLRAPAFVEVGVEATVALRADADPARVLPAAGARLQAHLDPLRGGSDGQGWPFGRPVAATELAALLERGDLVDRVEDLAVSGPDSAPSASVAIGPGDLVGPVPVTLAGYDSDRTCHRWSSGDSS